MANSAARTTPGSLGPVQVCRQNDPSLASPGERHPRIRHPPRRRPRDQADGDDEPEHRTYLEFFGPGDLEGPEAEHPRLMQRPVFVKGERAIIGRPKDRVAAFLAD
jgi:hypothetical protein